MKRLLACAFLIVAACTPSTDTSHTAQPDTGTHIEEPAPAPAWKTLSGEPPIVIAHRGASGTFPEHTLKAYSAAIEMGADFIEPDLVMTQDGVLVALHDAYLSETTDVGDHAEFADRKVKRQTPLGMREDWWVDDFTLEELRTLKARQRVAGRDHSFDGQYDIATFDEILDLVMAEAATGRKVGLHIEAKWPSYFSSVDLDMVAPILEALQQKGITGAGLPVFIQCFEPPFLSQMAGKSDLPLIQNLVGPPYDVLFGLDFKLEDIQAAGVGANKTLIFNPDGTPTDYVARAHAEGLLVHVYTVRDDEPAPGFASAMDELEALYDLGVDGVWTDYPETALKVRSTY